MEIIREYFGIGGYQRTPEGAYSWQHLTFVGSLLALMVILAVWLGLRNKKRNFATKNRVMIWAAILMDGLELIKIGLACYNSHVTGFPWYEGILYNLPLFLCSIMLIAIPLAAFTGGRVRQVCEDFVALFGILGAVAGTIGAAQNYACYPVLGFDNMVSGFTHSISGFTSLYVMIGGLSKLRWRNAVPCLALLALFCGGAMIANAALDYNYMFLRSHDGTPYQILYDLVGGHSVLYPVAVMGLFVVYMAIFYGIAALTHKKEKVTV